MKNCSQDVNSSKRQPKVHCLSSELSCWQILLCFHKLLKRNLWDVAMMAALILAVQVVRGNVEALVMLCAEIHAITVVMVAASKLKLECVHFAHIPSNRYGFSSLFNF